MKLTFISDTHSLHERMPPIAGGDVLIHCGDFTGRGSLEDTEQFAVFMATQDFTHKIVIAGNHDTCFEDHRRDDAETCLVDNGITYLNDSGITIEGMNFWGSPVQPEFFNWSFNRQRGEGIRRHWGKIPENTDVLITHGPPRGILDRCTNSFYAGCDDLLECVQRIKPKIHAFGHIHEAYGLIDTDDTTFINACTLNEHYQVQNPPIEISVL